MAKRRTKKQKLQARHKLTFEPIVKSQFKNGLKAASLSPSGPKKAKKLANLADPTDLKRDLLRSLILTSLILGLEIMIYLAWKR